MDSFPVGGGRKVDVRMGERECSPTSVETQKKWQQDPSLYNPHFGHHHFFEFS